MTCVTLGGHWLTVLDPTCGSGAFLFAALRILETLDSDCLERMERFVEDVQKDGQHGEKFKDFKVVLSQIAQHPSERYFILKSIIINNLFGVDIMEEAVEICKLRLFLKLVAQVEEVEQIEPLSSHDSDRVSEGSEASGKSMHETQIVSCCVHHSDYDDPIVFYHKMNDVGESFDQAGVETIGGYRKQPWIFQDTINRCFVFSQELISQADLLLVIPERCFH